VDDLSSHIRYILLTDVPGRLLHRGQDSTDGLDEREVVNNTTAWACISI